MAALDTIKVTCQRPGQPEQSSLFQLVDGKLCVPAVLNKFGLITLELVAHAEPVVLAYRPDNGLSYTNFAPGSEIIVCGTAKGTPVFYRDVILTLPPSDDGSPERVRKYDRVTRTTLQKLVDREGCDIVQDPTSRDWVDFELLDLHDNVLLTAQRASTPMDKRVSTIEGFVQSSVRAYEADAAEAMYQQMQEHHSYVEVLPIRNITSASGEKREVDGAVVAADCAAILEAKQVLDEDAVQQLESCMNFIKTQQLSGMAAKLQGKKLVGYVAGRTVTSDPTKLLKLVSSCQEKGYGILVTSGKAFSLGNSRMRRLEVQCTLRRNICCGLRSFGRTLL